MQGQPRSLDGWMAYLQQELGTACEQLNLHFQIRRSRRVREKPVAESTIDDYEWKPIPAVRGRFSAADSEEGTYYVFSVDTNEGVLRLQHDTHHAGVAGRHLWLETFTTFPMAATLRGAASPGEMALRNFVVDIVGRFEPNIFSCT